MRVAVSPKPLDNVAVLVVQYIGTGLDESLTVTTMLRRTTNSVAGIAVVPSCPKPTWR